MHQKDPLEGDFDTKGGWGQTNKVTKNSYFVPFLLKFSSLSLFLTSVSLFSTSPTVHTIDFCWLALFLFLQKHVFMNKTPTKMFLWTKLPPTVGKIIPAITALQLWQFLLEMFSSEGEKQKREKFSALLMITYYLNYPRSPWSLKSCCPKRRKICASMRARVWRFGFETSRFRNFLDLSVWNMVL